MYVYRTCEPIMVIIIYIYIYIYSLSTYSCYQAAWPTRWRQQQRQQLQYIRYRHVSWRYLSCISYLYLFSIGKQVHNDNHFLSCQSVLMVVNPVWKQQRLQQTGHLWRFLNDINIFHGSQLYSQCAISTWINCCCSQCANLPSIVRLTNSKTFRQIWQLRPWSDWTHTEKTSSHQSKYTK